MACVFNLVKYVNFRCNVFGKGERDGGVCVFKTVFLKYFSSIYSCYANCFETEERVD